MKKDIIITEQQLKELNACQSGIDWFVQHKVVSLRPLVTELIKDNKPEYARWLLGHLMTHPQQTLWAIYSAEQVMKLFEKKYPKDKRPRLAIKAAKDFLAGKISKKAAYAAADAAYAAADAAANAANAAANAAYAAADAAANAANAAADAANAAANAAYAAADAAYAAARDKMNKKLLGYALKMLGV